MRIGTHYVTLLSCPWSCHDADTPGEDILSVLYDALEFIDTALKGGGKVLVHCSQGVSRSATLVIAYLMWRSGSSYDEVYAKVKEARGITNPNIGESVKSFWT